MKELNYTEEQLECISELTPQAVGSLLSPRHVTKEEVLALLHDAVQR